MTDISKEAVDVAANVLRVTNEHYIATLLTALRAALDEAEARARDAVLDAMAARGQAAMAYEAQLRAEAERDAANALLRDMLRYLPDGIVECRGDKCREPWCASCFGWDAAEAGSEKAAADKGRVIAHLGAKP